MRPYEDKAKFIRLRAEGKSYSIISKELGISKSTCTAWNDELKDEVQKLKQEQLEELYESYFMKKEARIKHLGESLKQIDLALEDADLSRVPPERLLDFKLRYMEALKEEYAGGLDREPLEEDLTPSEIMRAYGELLDRVRSGEVTGEQANKEAAVLSSVLKVYELTEIKAKLDALTEIVGSRK